MFSGTFEDMEVLLARCGWIINSRPLAVRSYTEVDWALVSPTDVLLGRAARANPQPPQLASQEDISCLTHMETVARAFYTATIKETLQEMVPRRKWRWQQRNVQIGDVCFIAYESKFSRPWFRHCRVVKVHPDLQCTVRTVTVCFRPVGGGPQLPRISA